MTKHKLGCMACVILLLLFAALLVPILFFSEPVMAQQSSDELTLVTVEGVSHNENPVEGAKEVTAKAMTDTAREQVIEMLGDKKYQKNKALIENKIIHDAAKFIPFVNASEPQKVGDEGGGYKINVELKISQGSLQKMIAAAGLLVDSDGTASLLPMISFYDQLHAPSASYSWWLGQKEDPAHPLSPLSVSLNQALYSEFSRQGLYVLRPQIPATVGLLSENARVEHLSAEALKNLGDDLQTSMVIRGDVTLRDTGSGNEAVMKLAVLQTRNGRIVADVTRTVAIEKSLSDANLRTRLSSQFTDLAKDLSVQVLEVWQKGTLGASTLTLSVRGKLAPKQLGQFKNEITRGVHEIKALKERFFEPGRVVFEMEYNGAATQMAERFRSINLPDFTFQVTDVTDKGVSLEVKSR